MTQMGSDGVGHQLHGTLTLMALHGAPLDMLPADIASGAGDKHSATVVLSLLVHLDMLLQTVLFTFFGPRQERVHFVAVT